MDGSMVLYVFACSFSPCGVKKNMQKEQKKSIAANNPTNGTAQALASAFPSKVLGVGCWVLGFATPPAQHPTPNTRAESALGLISKDPKR